MRVYLLCSRVAFHSPKAFLGQRRQFLAHTVFSRRGLRHVSLETSSILRLYEDSRARNLTSAAGNADLVRLVSEGMFGMADRLRLQLIEDGIEIHLHPIYEKAAVAALNWPLPDRRLSEFSTWFSLVPDIDEAAFSSNPFQDIRNGLLRSGVPAQRLAVAFRFGAICASKGYLEPMFHEIIQLVVRYSTAREGARFLLDMEKAFVQYYLDRHPHNLVDFTRQFRASAVEICCQAGWGVIAVKIAQLPREFALPDRTYDLLMQRLRGRKSIYLKPIVENLRSNDAMKGIKPSPLVPNPPRPGKTTTDTAIKSGAGLPQPNLRSRSKSHQVLSRELVAKELRTLRHLFRAGKAPEKGRMMQYLTNIRDVDGSSRLLALLRNRALSNNLTQWLIAELKLHNAMGDYNNVLSLFSANIDREGYLPEAFDCALSQILPTSGQSAQRHVRDGKPRLPLHHRHLILKSIVHLSTTLPCSTSTVEKLYASYLSSLTPTKSRTIRSSGYSQVFSSFIRAFGECQRIKQAQSVLRDMRMLELKPDRRQLDMLAGVYAQMGDVEHSLAILDKIEEPDGGRGAVPKVIWMGEQVEIDGPRLSTYGRVIHGFVRAGFLHHALLAETRLRQRFTYNKGDNPRLDQALESLQKLRESSSGIR